MNIGDAAQVRAAKLARNSLEVFVKLAWPLLNPGVPLIWGWHLSAVCEHLEAAKNGWIKKLIINLPPATSKTSLVAQCFPVWAWLTEPESRWLFAAYNQDLSTRDSLARRNLIQSDWFRTWFAPEWQIMPDQRLKTQYANERAGWHKATSVGGGITGWHADYQVIDDPMKAQDLQSTRLYTHVRWYFETFESRVRDAANSRRIVIMQRLARRDLTGVLLEQGGWEHLCLPAEFVPERRASTSIGWQDPRTEPGELLDPVRLPKSLLEQYRLGGENIERGLGSAIYAAQYQQDPVIAGGNIIKRDWIRFYRGSERPKEFEQFIGAWDMSFKGFSTSDFVVGQVWGRIGASYYLLDQSRGQWGFSDTARNVESLAVKWPQVRRWLIEEAANGYAILNFLRPTVPGLVGVKPKESKIARFSAVSHIFERGDVFLPAIDENGWVETVVDELTSFPSGAKDDIVDATAWALSDMAMRARVTTMPLVHFRDPNRKGGLVENVDEWMEMRRQTRQARRKRVEAFRQIRRLTQDAGDERPSSM